MVTTSPNSLYRENLRVTFYLCKCFGEIESPLPPPKKTLPLPVEAMCQGSKRLMFYLVENMDPTLRLSRQKLSLSWLLSFVSIFRKGRFFPRGNEVTKWPPVAPG